MRASWCARTAPTVSGSRSALRKRTTPCCASRPAGFEEDAMSLARKKFTEFKERGGDIPDAELDDFWATLEPATIDGMLGEWKGGEFVTGHKMNGKLEKLGWFGKTFNSAADGQPLVSLNADRNNSSNPPPATPTATLLL